MTLDQALLAAVVAMGGVITFLYKEQRKESGRNAKLAERMGQVEGRHEGIEKLSAETLEIVSKAKQCRYRPQENTRERQVNNT